MSMKKLIFLLKKSFFFDFFDDKNFKIIFLQEKITFFDTDFFPVSE